jgi:serine/threonine-protein kinase
VIGTIVDGRYAIERELGAGAMGLVYEAVHRGTGRRVALKVILREKLGDRQALVERFQREARAAGVIDTRHIAKVTDTGIDPTTERPYLVMDLLKGEDAGALLGRCGPLNVTTALKIVAQACLGLSKAHEAGVIHRDVKPANLFLDEQDEGEVVVKICDFGVAKVKMEDATEGDQGLTRTGSLVGSPLFMAPEQARGRKDIDARVDLWSLAVALYQLLCGRTPFHDVQALGDLIIAICGEPTPPLQERAPWVPPDVARLVHVALQLDPAKRFQSARQMLAALRALLPEGERLHRSDLVAITEAERAIARERIDPEAVGSASELAGIASRDATVPTSGATTRKEHREASRADTVADAVMARSDVGEKAAAQTTSPMRLRPWWGIAAGFVLAIGAYAALGSRTPRGVASANASATQPSASASVAAFTADHPAVVVGNVFSGFFAFRSGAFLDAVKKAGLPLAYRVERNPIKRHEAVDQGTAHFVVTSIDRVLANPVKGRIVALLGTSSGAHGLLLDPKEFPGVTDMTALGTLIGSRKKEGKKVGLVYPKDSVGEYLVTLFGARIASFPTIDFDMMPVETSTNAYDALAAEGNGVALAVTWEPYITRGQAAGFPLVLSSADVDGAIVDVLVASDAVLQAHPEAVATVVERYYRFIDARIAQPQEMTQQIAEDGKLTLDEARSLVAGLRFFSAVGAARWMKDGTLKKRLEQTAAVLSLAGKIDAAPADANKLFVTEHVDAAAKETQKLIDTVRASDPLLAARLEGSEGGDAPKLDPAKVTGADVVGQLGVVYFAAGKRELDDAAKSVLDRAAEHASDFNPRTTAIALSGLAREKSTGEKLAGIAAGYLKSKRVELAIVPLSRGFAATGQRDRVQIDLVRVK